MFLIIILDRNFLGNNAFCDIGRGVLFHSSWTVQSPLSAVDRSLDNADFKSPRAQKSIGDTSRNLAGISVKGIVLIPVSSSFFFLV